MGAKTQRDDGRFNHASSMSQASVNKCDAVTDFSAAASMLIQQGNETSTKESTDSSCYRGLITDPVFQQPAQPNAQIKFGRADLNLVQCNPAPLP